MSLDQLCASIGPLFRPSTAKLPLMGGREPYLSQIIFTSDNEPQSARTEKQNHLEAKISAFFGYRHAGDVVCQADGVARHADNVSRHGDGVARHGDGVAYHADADDVMRHADGVVCHADGLARYADGVACHANDVARHADGIARHADDEEQP